MDNIQKMFRLFLQFNDAAIKSKCRPSPRTENARFQVDGALIMGCVCVRVCVYECVLATEHLGNRALSLSGFLLFAVVLFAGKLAH